MLSTNKIQNKDNEENDTTICGKWKGVGVGWGDGGLGLPHHHLYEPERSIPTILYLPYKRVIQANLVTCLDNRKFCIDRIQRRFPHNPLHRYSGPGCYNFCGECVHRYHKRKSSHPRPPTETILRLLSGRKACIISISVAMKTWTLLISNQCTLK